MYSLSPILKKRLIQYGLNEDEIQTKIKEYVGETRDYVSLVLPNFLLTEGQLKIITDNYVQYKLFSMLEMETFVEDKRIFLDSIIDSIKRDKKESMENNINQKAQNKGLMVF